MRLIVQIAILALLIADALHAAQNRDDIPYGFAMFSMGLQSTQYQQRLKDEAGNRYDSKTVASSPYLLTGSLTQVNQRYAFSIFAASTLFVSPSVETFHREGEAFDTHTAKFSLNTLDFTGYYSVQANHALSFGLQYSYEVLQRFGFNNPLLLERNASVVEVKTATFTPHIGYLYSSNAKAGSSNWRYLAAADFGLPIVYVSSNTYEQQQNLFTKSAGNYSAGIRGYAGYRIIAGLELGFHASALYLQRSDNINYTVEGTTNSILQETILQRYQVGVAINWNYIAFEALR